MYVFGATDCKLVLKFLSPLHVSLLCKSQQVINSIARVSRRSSIC